MFFWAACGAAQEVVPQLAVEVSPGHPLFLFGVDVAPEAAAEAHLAAVQTAWQSLPEDLRPFAVLAVDVSAFDVVGRNGRFGALLSALPDVPMAIHLSDGNPQFFHPLSLTEDLMKNHTNLKGFIVSGLRFTDYYSFGAGADLATPPQVRWLAETLRIARTYGRFMAIDLDRAGWVRVMSNALCAPLFEAIRTSKGNVIPLCSQTDAHTVTGQMATMGLWLEESTDHWGVSPSAAWFAQARFISPGVFGVNANPLAMPPPFYRAMILNGAMGGAEVYWFRRGSDLWAGQNRIFWDAAIAPTLRDLVDKSLIAPKESVRKKCMVAYQLNVAQTLQEFTSYLSDVDGVWAEGKLIHGAYGMERPRQVPELILNSGRHYWVPIHSAYARAEVLGGPDLAYARVVRPGEIANASEWTALLDQHYVPDASGTAFVSRIARGVFIMHTRENAYEEQSFRIPDMPSPLRGLKAARQADGVRLEWPFRENDFSYRIYRRAAGLDGPFVLVADVSETYNWTDTAITGNAPASYAIAAITNEKEVFEGTVNYGDYRAYSAVESRLVEEIVVTQLLNEGVSQSMEQVAAPPLDIPWWPNYDGVPPEFQGEAEAIAARFEEWDAAVRDEQLDTVMEIYTQDYRDPQLWPFAYAKRAFQWFFERYGQCRMDRQIRQWDFSKVTTDEQIRVLLYCRFTGVALDNPDAPMAFFPRTDTGEIWLTFTNKEGPWRIEYAEPALPNMRDILSFSSPDLILPPGPDIFAK